MSESSDYESDSKPAAENGELGKAKRNKRRSNVSPRNLPSKKRTQIDEDHSNQSTLDECDHDQLTIEQHRELVKSIYEIGLAEASPLLIFEHMSEKIKTLYPELNIEKLKSKLQKYRKNKDKYREEFMKEYDENLKNILIGYPTRFGMGGATTDSCPVMPSENIISSGGPDIAYLTYCDISNSSVGHLGSLMSSNSRQMLTGTGRSSATFTNNAPGNNGSFMSLPILTPSEMRSPIGQSFEYFLALFESLRSDLYEQRSYREHQLPSHQNTPRESLDVPTEDQQDVMHVKNPAQEGPNVLIVNLDQIDTSNANNENTKNQDK